MRTVRQWLGTARRWTPTGYQRDVEEPTTVLVVGHDEDDGSLLWLGMAIGSVANPTVALIARTDLFVVALAGVTDGAANAAVPGDPAKMQVQVAGLPSVAPPVALYSRSGGFAPNEARFGDLVAFAGGVLPGPTFGSFDLAPRWVPFDEPGMLLRQGERLAVSTLGGVLEAGIAVQWRGSV